jgi:type IV secretion system protein VirB2
MQQTISVSRVQAQMRHWRRRIGGAVILTIAGAGQSLASTSGGLPWDGPVQTLQNDLTGPIATGISVVALLGAGAALAFGGDELGGVAKKLLYLVLAIAIIVLGNNFLSALGLSGALV